MANRRVYLSHSPLETGLLPQGMSGLASALALALALALT
eukprot:SAG11_NODE_823_length_6997_cov_60.301247_1_plen_39_part_00